MTDTVDNLILDLLEWIAAQERAYDAVMDVWRTSCPRLAVWEDATDRGLIETVSTNGRLFVRVTPAGHSFLNQGRPQDGRTVS